MTTVRPPIDPTPVPVEKMLKWSLLTDQLEGMPLAELRELAHQFIDDELEALKELSSIKRDLETADDDEIADELALAGLKVGNIHAHVYSTASNHCYRIEPFFWLMTVDHEGAIDAIQKGIAPTLLLKFVDRALDQKLAKEPLFIEESSYNKFIKPRPPSEKKLIETAHYIIASHPGSEHPTKDQFMSELISRYPRCTKNRAARIWTQTVPSQWREPGRPKKR